MRFTTTLLSKYAALQWYDARFPCQFWKSLSVGELYLYEMRLQLVIPGGASVDW